jgi:hypothetical protein
MLPRTGKDSGFSVLRPLSIEETFRERGLSRREIEVAALPAQEFYERDYILEKALI